MSDLIIPDVSEFQGTVDWPRLVAAGYPAVIVRAHNGTRADEQWSRNRAQAHAAGVRALGLYQYLVADRDAAVQAEEFCDLVGQLLPGEWPICDLEVGDGDQAARARAWYTTVAARLQNARAEELYSGLAFYQAHGLAAAGYTRVWLAAYGPTEPTLPHELWQFTDARTVPGITNPCDASVFHGTVADLLTHITPEADMPLTTADVTLLLGTRIPEAKLASGYVPTIADCLNGAKTADTQLTALTAQVGALTGVVTALAKAVGTAGGLTAEQAQAAAEGGAAAALAELGQTLVGTTPTTT